MPVAGQVDRLVVTPDEVLIADYKTNRPPPNSLDEALEKYGSYVKQLALYRAVLKRLYPGRPVRAALMWTETPELMEFQQTPWTAPSTSAGDRRHHPVIALDAPAWRP